MNATTFIKICSNHKSDNIDYAELLEKIERDIRSELNLYATAYPALGELIVYTRDKTAILNYLQECEIDCR